MAPVDFQGFSGILSDKFNPCTFNDSMYVVSKWNLPFRRDEWHPTTHVRCILCQSSFSAISHHQTVSFNIEVRPTRPGGENFEISDHVNWFPQIFKP